MARIQSNKSELCVKVKESVIVLTLRKMLPYTLRLLLIFPYTCYPHSFSPTHVPLQMLSYTFSPTHIPLQIFPYTCYLSHFPLHIFPSIYYPSHVPLHMFPHTCSPTHVTPHMLPYSYFLRSIPYTYYPIHLSYRLHILDKQILSDCTQPNLLLRLSTKQVRHSKCFSRLSTFPVVLKVCLKVQFVVCYSAD